LLQPWYARGALMAEEMLVDSDAVRRFAGIEFEAVALEDILDAAVEPLDHAVRLRPKRRGQAELDPEGGAQNSAAPDRTTRRPLFRDPLRSRQIRLIGLRVRRNRGSPPSLQGGAPGAHHAMERARATRERATARGSVTVSGMAAFVR
jgi:hypothetical protein